MARYTGPACRLCRREGRKLYLKGERCLTGKCAVERRASAPGQHGAQSKKLKEYGMQLRAKQTAKRYYGVQEGQFAKYYEKASKKTGVTGENLLSLLERRLATSFTEWVWQKAAETLVSWFCTVTSD